jgi:hypothetical protein
MPAKTKRKVRGIKYRKKIKKYYAFIEIGRAHV